MVPDINLLPNLEQKKSAPALVYIILIALTAIILGCLIFVFFQAKSEITTLSASEETLTKQRDKLQTDLDEKLNANKGSLAQSVQFVENVSYPVTPLITETQSMLPKFTYLRDYEFGEESVNITVDFETMSAISAYVEKLTTSSYFSDTQVGSISNFDVEVDGEEKDDKEKAKDKFKEVPRYSVTVTLAIDSIYLAGGNTQ
ncbi:MAG: hypothetical protein RR595_01970 [Lysinibacillus sp.]